VSCRLNLEAEFTGDIEAAYSFIIAKKRRIKRGGKRG
jgi:hypothetical protein